MNAILLRPQMIYFDFLPRGKTREENVQFFPFTNEWTRSVLALISLVRQSIPPADTICSLCGHSWRDYDCLSALCREMPAYSFLHLKQNSLIGGNHRVRGRRRGRGQSEPVVRAHALA